LGPGSPPAGDHFLMGLVAGLRLWPAVIEVSGLHVEPVLKRMIAGAAERTSLLGWMLLNDALNHIYAKPWHDLAALLREPADARPPEMPQDKYERTLRARAFDVARYLLPMGVRTGLGQVLSARTLERMLVRLLSHPLQEVREVARELKAAVVERPAFNPTVERLRPMLDELRGLLEKLDKGEERERARALMQQIERRVGVGAKAAPTLIKYAEPSPYLRRVQEALEELAARYGRRLGEEPDGARGVRLHGPQDPLDELACTLLYRALPH